MTTKPVPAEATNANKVLEAKWGKTLIVAGFTALPDVIFQYQKALKLKPLDVLILLHLASYCRCRLNSDPPCRFNIDPGRVVAF